MKLKPGDKVLCINGNGGGWEGMIGTVLFDEGNSFLVKYGVYADSSDIYDSRMVCSSIPIAFNSKSENGNGHDLSGLITDYPDHCGWWFRTPLTRFFKKITVNKQYEFKF